MLRSHCGKEMFRYEYNFIYTLIGKNKDGTKLYWTCSPKTTCKSRVHTVNSQVVFRSETHTHAADTAEASARLVINTMVSSVSNGHESTRNVIRDSIQGCSKSTLAALPSRRTLSRRMQRARRKLNPTPLIPV
jgi:hypothetical protein